MDVDLSAEVVLRWDSAANCAPLVEPGGIDAVWLRGGDALAAACRAAGVKTLSAGAIRLISLEEAGNARPGEPVALKAGTWPGAQAPSRTSDGAFIAGATQRAWVSANGYLVGWLRAINPGQAPVLGYLPDRDAGISEGQVVPYGSLELALIDAWCAGGNYILAPDERYREALLRGDAAATAAWSQMGRTARWLKEHRALFRQPAVPTITVLVEPDEATAEIANLMYRQSASPDLVSASRVPPPDPARRAVIVAAGIRSLSAGAALLAHARAGAAVVTDVRCEGAWWQVPGLKREHTFEDREFCRLGSGRIVVYTEEITDPGDFALDAIDLAGPRRPVRLWDFSSAVAAVSQDGPHAKPVLRVINYGSQGRSEVLARVPGKFDSATLLRPGSEPAPLRISRRAEGTEVRLPAPGRLSVVVFG